VLQMIDFSAWTKWHVAQLWARITAINPCGVACEAKDSFVARPTKPSAACFVTLAVKEPAKLQHCAVVAPYLIALLQQTRACTPPSADPGDLQDTISSKDASRKNAYKSTPSAPTGRPPTGCARTACRHILGVKDCVVVSESLTPSEKSPCLIHLLYCPRQLHQCYSCCIFCSHYCTVCPCQSCCPPHLLERS
jgi:hypothetical protein